MGDAFEELENPMVIPLYVNGIVPYKRRFEHSVTSYVKKRERRERHLKEMLKQKVYTKASVAGMMSALVQLVTNSADIVDLTLLELWREVMSASRLTLTHFQEILKVRSCFV